MPVAAATLWVLAQAGAAATPLRPAVVNSTADLLVERSLALGIDFAPPEPGKSRAAGEDLQAFAKAAPGSWLDAQIQIADDSIAEPPKELRDFLDEHREPLWAIIAALEKAPPEWKAKEWEEEIPRLLPWIRLHKVLLATALSEVQAGSLIEAERALEASWSLSRGFPGTNVLITRMISVAAGRWQAGVLRKFREPPVPWVSRLASDEPWRKMAEALEADAKITEPLVTAPEPDPSQKLLRDSSHKLWTKAMDTIAEKLRKTSPCDREALTGEAIWRPAAAVFALDRSEAARGLEPIQKESIQGNVSSMIRRTARLMVDRELTLKILQLRLARAASRDHRWPEEAEVTSAVCPGVTYAYQAGESKMQIRFEGSVDAPEAGVVLPLVYAALDRPAAPAQ